MGKEQFLEIKHRSLVFQDVHSGIVSTAAQFNSVITYVGYSTRWED